MIIIKDKKDCTGCHGCSNICPKSCISMESDNEGFWYPKVNYDKCINCGLCLKVCPIINKRVVNNEPRAYACINKDEAIRLKSSSGGLFTLISEKIIDNGGVVFGVGFDESFEVLHSYVYTKEELEKFRKSKYVQSKIGESYKQVKEFLEQGRAVVFTGTPCQIGGLKSYLGQPYENLFSIDIVCHGVPSPKVWQKYIEYQQNLANSSIKKISFRSKNKGWKRFSMFFSFNNETEYIQTLDKDLYMQAFLKDICLRKSCYACEFKTLHRQSDITLADFWGIENILPEIDDDKGVSLMLVNSDKGHSMLEQIIDKVLCKEVDIDKAIYYNTPAIKSAIYNPKRDAFLNGLDVEPFSKLVKKYSRDKFLVKVGRKTKSIVRTVLIKTRLLNIVKKLLRKA